MLISSLSSSSLLLFFSFILCLTEYSNASINHLEKENTHCVHFMKNNNNDDDAFVSFLGCHHCFSFISYFLSFFSFLFFIIFKAICQHFLCFVNWHKIDENISSASDCDNRHIFSFNTNRTTRLFLIIFNFNRIFLISRTIMFIVSCAILMLKFVCTSTWWQS
jgi:hypothetical protein